MPEVVFIEPTYTDAPHHREPADAHPLSSILHSETFLRNIYRLLTADKDVWASSALIVSYDEHGGFFNHEPPRAISTPIPTDAEYSDPFTTTGVRVPGLVVSPFISAGQIFSRVLDHTSILKFLAERFRTGNGGRYSPEVDARPVESLSAVFDLLDEPRVNPPAPPPPPEYLLESTPNQRAFQARIERLAKMYPSQADAKFPELRFLGLR